MRGKLMSTNRLHPKNQVSAYLSLTRRHLKVFFKDIPTVIFTMMMPLTIFAVYLLFLRNLQVNQIQDYFPGYNDLSTSLQQKICALADSWMISGVLGVSTVTVSLNCQHIMVKDKENQLIRDTFSSPIEPNVVMFSYFTFNIIVSFLINLLVFFISMIVLVCYNAFYISALNFFGLIGVLLYSSIIGALFSFFISFFVNTEAVMSPIMAIVSAAIGFLVGAYLPCKMMPRTINNLTAFFPGTYSIGLFRTFLMGGQIENIQQSLPPENIPAFITTLKEQFNVFQNAEGNFYISITFFDVDVNPGYMSFALFVFGIIYLGADLVALHFKRFWSINQNALKKVKKKKDK